MDILKGVVVSGVLALGALVFASALVASSSPEGVSDEMWKKYKFHRILGKGAFGTVHLVEHQTRKKQYAMKVIQKVINGFTSKEAKVMKALNHPNVTHLYDLSETSKHMNLVMDFMEGGSLQDRLNLKKSLSQSIARLYFYQMCQAIEYLHEKNITHRDLKPDNILLASKADRTLLKVSDFGLSKNDIDYYLTSDCGTKLFMAPEYFLDGINRYSNKVDIWSLGVILYNCVSGDYPFVTPQAIVRNQCQFGQSVWKTCSKDAMEIIKKMLTKNFNERPDISFVFETSWLNDEKLVNEYAQIIAEI